jgi:hypothetical protein
MVALQRLLVVLIALAHLGLGAWIVARGAHERDRSLRIVGTLTVLGSLALLYWYFVMRGGYVVYTHI